MSKAYKAPMDSYEPHFAVTEHAVQRFRERADRFLVEGGYLSDEAVACQVDSLVVEAIDNGKRHDILDYDDPARLVDIGDRRWGPLFALVKHNTNRRYSQGEAVVTLLTDWMIVQSDLEGRYRGDVPKFQRFTRQYEMLAQRKAAEAAASMPPAAAPVPTAPAELALPVAACAAEPQPATMEVPNSVATCVSEPATTVSSPEIPEPKPVITASSAVSPVAFDPSERRLVAHLEDGHWRYEELPRAEVASRLEALVLGGVASSDIRVWKPAELRIRVEVD